MKIGFQGDLFSNSEEASQIFAKKMYFENVEFIPLISSKNVVKNLITKNIDFGVMATKNIIAGDVIETKEALTPNIELISSIDLPIHHCLFKKTENSSILYVASHIQALQQTKETRKKILKDVPEIECSDTSLAAKMLANGKYPENYGVICRENAGLFFNLFLVAKNIEDNPFNTTRFGLFQLKKS